MTRVTGGWNRSKQTTKLCTNKCTIMGDGGVIEWGTAELRSMCLQAYGYLPYLSHVVYGKGHSEDFTLCIDR
jgi:hypothetical protein